MNAWQELWASQRLGKTISVLDIRPHKRRHDVIPSIHVAEIVNRVLEVLVNGARAAGPIDVEEGRAHAPAVSEHCTATYRSSSTANSAPHSP